MKILIVIVLVIMLIGYPVLAKDIYYFERPIGCLWMVEPPAEPVLVGCFPEAVPYKSYLPVIGND